MMSQANFFLQFKSVVNKSAELKIVTWPKSNFRLTWAPKVGLGTQSWLAPPQLGGLGAAATSLLLPDIHMIWMIMELVQNTSFTLASGSDKQSRLLRLKNGVSQWSVSDSVSNNIYAYNLPSFVTTKYTSANDLTLLHTSKIERAQRES